MNRIWLFSEWSGEVNRLFTGYAEAYEQAWPDGGWSQAVTNVRAADETKVLNLASLPTSGAVSGTSMALQLHMDLDAVQNRAPRLFPATTALDASDTRSWTGQSVKSDMDIIESLDYTFSGTDPNYMSSAWFVSADGTITVLKGDHRLFGATRYTSVQATFDDDGTDLPYGDCVVDYSDSFLFNSVTVNYTGGAQVRTDAASINLFGVRQLTLSIPCVSPEAGFIADRLIAQYKLPKTRITSVTPDLSNAEGMRLTLARDLLDRIEVFRTPPGGGARMDQVSFIQNITMSGEPGQLPAITFGVSPL